MTPTKPAEGSLPLVATFQFPDFAVSWAGSGLRDDEFCFGSEDGRLLFTTVEGRITGGLISGEENSEAVNGVAFIGAVIAVSTRKQITLWTHLRPGSNEVERVVINCGAHGVIGTAEGYFVAPLGVTGLMKVLANREDEQLVTVTRATGQTFNYYRAISLHSYGQPGILVCATRSGGILATDNLLQGRERGQLWSISLPGLDVVDVCSLGTGELPRAVAGLGRNGTLVLSRDVLRDRSPVTMKFDDIPGTAYRIFSAQGSLLVLTSAGLYVLQGLSQRFLAGEPVDRGASPVRGIPLEAVDANLCGERWLLVVMPDCALRLDLNFLIGGVSGGEPLEESRPAKPTTIPREWTIRDMATELSAVG